MAVQEAALENVNLGVKRLVQAVAQAAGDTTPGANQWLAALLERHGPMAETLANALDASTTLTYTQAQIAAGQAGQPLAPDALTAQALERAQARGKDMASERDIAGVILEAAGYTLQTSASSPAPASALPAASSASTPPDSAAAAQTAAADRTAPAGENTSAEVKASADSNGAGDSSASSAPDTSAANAPAAKKAAESKSPAAPAPAAWKPKAKRPTPALARFGRDLTQAAHDGKLSALVGRAEETDLMIETLCRRTKRNPVLVGPAGVGKTAIVEGLARRIVAGTVPVLLQNARVFALQPSTLIAGAGYGDLEKRLEAIVAEASQDGILLFIDEVHAIVGAGGRPGAGDMASLLKPALARGEIACIAATTDDEYRRFIEEDPALERRFQPLRVHELSGAQTLAVLEALRDELHQSSGVVVSRDALHDIVAFAERYMPNRHFPDKAVDLLEQAVAHALATGQTEVTRSDAMQVANRLVGMPLSGEGWQDALRLRLHSEGILSSEDTALLINRLGVTLPGFDIHPARPNAIVLLTGPAAQSGHRLAETLAQTLFGGEDRIVTLDFSRFTEPHHVSMLIGSPPGYVGYSEHLPIHDIARMPWCVLLCTNMDACHPVVRDVLTQALATGFLTDAQGKRLFLSDTITILTTSANAAVERKMGIRTHEPITTQEQKDSRKDSERAAATQALGAELVRLCDLIGSHAHAATGQGSALDSARRQQETLLNELAARYAQHGLAVQWNDSLHTWLDAQGGPTDDAAQWERLLDNELSPLLVAQIANRTTIAPLALFVEFRDNALHVTAQNAFQNQNQNENQDEEQKSKEPVIGEQTPEEPQTKSPSYTEPDEQHARPTSAKPGSAERTNTG